MAPIRARTSLPRTRARTYPSPPTGPNLPRRRPALANLFPRLLHPGLAGATSALLTTPLLAPGERAKCLLQSQVGRPL